MSGERYKIKDKIGKGGVGAVYKAFDSQLSREVALKRILSDDDNTSQEGREDATKQLLKEATALSSIQHPNIVTVYDVGIDSKGPYVVMELIDGQTLDEMVERAPLTWDDLREIALQTQEALIAAQNLDLLHRDLKPSNVMICWLPSGKFQVKIVDFGLAKLSASPSLQTIDHGDAVFGSIYFMAPEQFERTPLDQRTDMYAMGCLYYYALTGQYPFTGDTAAQVMGSHLQHNVQDLAELRPDIPAWGAEWVMWHIERNLEDRPTNARESLERFLIQEQQPAPTGAKTLNASATENPATSTKAQFIFPGQEQQTQVKDDAQLTPSSQPLAPAAAQSIQPPQSTETATQKTATVPQSISPPNAELSPYTKAQEKSATTPDQPDKQNTATDAPSPKKTQTKTPQKPIKSAKKTMPTAAKWAVAGLLSLVLLVAIILGLSIKRERDQANMITQVLIEAKELNDQRRLQDGIDLSKEQFNGVLSRIVNMKLTDNRALLLKTLAYAKASDDYDPNSIILEQTIKSKMPESIRADIFTTVMTRRKDIANVSPLIEFASSTQEDKSAAAAIHAARFSFMDNSADEYVDDFVTIITDTDSDDVRRAAESAASTIIKQSTNKSTFTNLILGTYQSALNDSVKFTMLRLLGSIGGNQAAEIITNNLKSQDIPLQIASLAAIENWEDDSQFNHLISFTQENEGGNLRQKAFDTAYSVLRNDRERNNDDLNKMWGSLADIASNQREKLQIIYAMANQKDKWAMSLLSRYDKDDDDKVTDRAIRAIKRLQNSIEKEKLKGAE